MSVDMPGTIEVPLTQGKVAIIDAADWPLLGNRKWCAHRDRFGTWCAETSSNGRQLRMGRVLLNPQPGELVHFLNGDTLDHRRFNLCLGRQRDVTRSMRKPRSGSTPFKGVRQERKGGRWSARIKVNYREIFLGSYATPREAALAYDTAARLHFGRFARLNFAEMSPLPGLRAGLAGAKCRRCEVVSDRENPLFDDLCLWCREELSASPAQLARRQLEAA